MLPMIAQRLVASDLSTDKLLELACRLSAQERSQVDQEIRQFVALRISFLLLAEASGADGFSAIERRIRARLPLPEELLSGIVDDVATTSAFLDAADATPRLGLRDLPYPARQRLMQRQNRRCGICGWLFGPDQALKVRSDGDASPSLDHRIPYRLGGDVVDNLWIVCGLCNRTKEASLHICDQGRIWSNNYVYAHREQLVAFWALMRGAGCHVNGCDKTAHNSRLFAVRQQSGPRVLDNCRVSCEEHVDHGAIIHY